MRIGDLGRTMQLAARLAQQGCFVPGIRPPTVPPGESLLRISLCHGHDQQAMSQLEDELEVCADFKHQP